jgi:hypothetical protein
MSRSRKKNNICGTTGVKSEKFDKQKSNRRLRKKIKQQIKNNKEVFSLKKEVSDLWTFGKDGKHFFDIKTYPKGMRK